MGMTNGMEYRKGETLEFRLRSAADFYGCRLIEAKDFRESALEQMGATVPGFPRNDTSPNWTMPCSGSTRLSSPR